MPRNVCHLRRNRIRQTVFVTKTLRIAKLVRQFVDRHKFRMRRERQRMADQLTVSDDSLCTLPVLCGSVFQGLQQRPARHRPYKPVPSGLPDVFSQTSRTSFSILPLYCLITSDARSVNPISKCVLNTAIIFFIIQSVSFETGNTIVLFILFLLA